MRERMMRMMLLRKMMRRKTQPEKMPKNQQTARALLKLTPTPSGGGSGPLITEPGQELLKRNRLIAGSDKRSPNYTTN